MNSFKQLLTAALCSLSFLHPALWQCNAQPCQNMVSTQPSAPYNFDPLFPSPNNLWLNTFNYGAHSVNSAGIELFDILLNPDAGWAIPDFTSPTQYNMMNPFEVGASPGAPYLSQPRSAGHAPCGFQIAEILLIPITKG